MCYGNIPDTSDGELKLSEAVKLSSQLYRKKVHYSKLQNSMRTSGGEVRDSIVSQTVSQLLAMNVFRVSPTQP